MATHQYQYILLSLGYLGAAWGAVLLCRHGHLPGTKSYGPWTGRLAYWPVNGFELGLLIALILMLCAIMPEIVRSFLGASWRGVAEKQALEMAVLGIAMHGGGLLAWPLFNTIHRQLFATAPAPASAAPVGPSGAKPGWARAFRDGGAAFLIALPLVLLVSLGWKWYLELIGHRLEPQDAIALFKNTRSPAILLGMLFVTCVVAPVNEELLFRRGLYHFLRQRLGRGLALGISAGIFGLVHFNAAGFLPLTALGMVLALAYERTGDIRVPMIAHGLFNLNTLLFLLAGLSE